MASDAEEASSADAEMSTIRTIVKRELTKLLRAKQQVLEQTTEVSYDANQSKMSQYIEERQREQEHPGEDYDIGNSPEITSGNSAAITSVYKFPKKVATIPECFQRPLPSLPSITFWSNIGRNIAQADDTVLSHTPYIDDNTADDEDWHQALREGYEHCIHMAVDDGFTDDILVKLVDELISKMWNDVKTGQEIRITKEIAFKCIAPLYRCHMSADEIKEKYVAYQKIKNGQPLMMTNIDDNLDRVHTREEALSSFQTLFCTRCFIYDCQAHNESPASYKPQDEDYSIKEACGENCFLNIDTINKANHVNLSDDSVYSKLPLATIKTDHWSNAEKTLLNVLHRTYQGNFCAISRLLGGKTCAEVYAMFEMSLDGDAKATARKQIVDDLKAMEENRNNKRLGNGKPSRIWSKHADKFTSDDASSSSSSNRTKPATNPYKPCTHPGECSEDNNICVCIRGGTFCEKFCNCSPTCENRFPGCSCRQGYCSTKQCSCYFAGRECDPDLCKSCGAAELDLLQQRDQFKCTNVALQRGFKKHILLGQSDISGWGAFLNEDAAKGELISEYTGEVISHEEADRRGLIYDRYKLSYIFDLNSEQSIDAHRVGRKIRFANHSSTPNCQAILKMVNGDHRIGIYATTFIPKGAELFLDYRCSAKNSDLKFEPIERQLMVVPVPVAAKK